MTHQEQATKKWLLARVRTIRAGIMLIVAQLDEIGIDLADGVITSEQAMTDLTCLEQLPVYFAAHILSPTSDEAAA
jgi:hypothetical protein